MKPLGLPSWRSALGFALSVDAVLTWRLSRCCERRRWITAAGVLREVSREIDDLSYRVMEPRAPRP